MFSNGATVYLKYSTESMDSSLKEVREGRLTCNAASKTYNVPRTTLRDKVAGKSPEKRRMGPSPVLTKAEEDSLAAFCIKLLKCGFPINRDDLMDIVQRVIKDDGRKNPFTEDRPGKYWFYGFMQRNPQLTERLPERLTGGRATVTELQIRKWFTDIQVYIVQEEGAGDILINPQRVFNFDESQFLLAKKKGTVLGPVNYKSFLEVSKENDKEGLTVLMGYSADGSLAPPMIVYAYKQNIPYDIIEAVGSVDPSWALGKSESGWMTTLTFFDYISQVFNPWLMEQQVQKPVLVFAGGHKSHLSPETCDFCASNGIFLVALYPNFTHMLQPLDVSVFKSLKGLWEKAKHKWKTSTLNQVITKKQAFPTFLSRLWIRLQVKQ